MALSYKYYWVRHVVPFDPAWDTEYTIVRQDSIDEGVGLYLYIGDETASILFDGDEIVCEIKPPNDAGN